MFIHIVGLTNVWADKVTDWNAIASQVLLNTNRGGAQGLIDVAYVHIAICDAVNAIDSTPYSRFAVRRRTFRRARPPRLLARKTNG